jgi:hypothetical protein
MMQEIFDYIQGFPVPIRWIFPLVVLAIFVWVSLSAQMLWQRTYRREKQLLELAKLRYEIEAIKKQNDLAEFDRTLDVPRLTSLVEFEQDQQSLDKIQTTNKTETEILDQIKSARQTRNVRFLFGSIGSLIGFWFVMGLAFVFGASPDFLDLIVLSVASAMVAVLSGAFVWCVFRRISRKVSALAAGAAIMPVSFLTILSVALLIFE